MKNRIKFLLVICVASVIAIGIFYFGKNFAPGSYPYAEVYKIEFPEKNVIDAIEKFKNQNPEFIVPKVTINNTGSFDLNKDEEKAEVSHWNHNYFYFKKENQIVSTWTRANENGKTNFALVSINKGLNIGNWKDVNHDLSDEESKKLKEEFEILLLNPIKQILEENK